MTATTTVGRPVLVASVRPHLLLASAALPRTGPAEPPPQGPVEDALAHEARLGRRPPGSAEVLAQVERAALHGLGGAHVPTASRWRRTLSEQGPLTVVANGAESEPVGAKDAILLRQRPHLVLDGLLLAAETLGARRVVVWLHGDDRGAHRALADALAERRWTQRSEPAIELVRGPSHYLAGQSSAIARALSGGPALPTTPRPDRADSGRTLVQNVETLARVALLARGHAPTGTTLLTVLLPSGRHVVEVERSTAVQDVLADVAGGAEGPPPRAVLVGGFGGQWVAWDRIRHLPVDEPALRSEGLSLGAGILAPLPRETCGISETASLVSYLASMSARQCGPCTFGLPALADHLAALAAGSSSRRALDRLLADARAIEGRGACHHPDGATRLVASAVATFREEISAHVQGRACPLQHSLAFPVPEGTP
ncbi:NADH-ubiquinone oxidoreductase-F iron-sulfur binding region domain-containing protein [Cellulomonas sp. ICMP 17802]|uniref:NADH-ubiquinone oxidoreductase-F iron-sulfur binding region domain-containing protein n=1 Tax=Cellulomonas sp. ICMP 17802 TaxID=3239199 RepID=UPI00351ABEC3